MKSTKSRKVAEAKMTEELEVEKVKESRRSRSGELRSKLMNHPFWRLETGLGAAALVIGLVSAAINHSRRNAEIEEIRSAYQLSEVIVAAKKLGAGSVLDRNSFKVGRIPTKMKTANFVSNSPEKMALIEEKTIKVELNEGDPILLSAVEGIDSNKGFAERIPAGKRFFSLVIKDKAAKRGWVTPNDHVDILANVNLPERGVTTFTILEDVTLVSVGEATLWEEGKKGAGSEIGFFVSPEEMEFLTFAQEKGTFSLSLRNPQDMKRRNLAQNPSDLRGVDANTFLDHKRMSDVSGGGSLEVTVDGKKAGTTTK